MSRWIDADVVSNLLAKKCYELDHTNRVDYGAGCGIAKEIVDQSPSIDIVRCRECKFYQPYDYHRKYDCNWGLVGVMGDDFCSYGERRCGK